MNESPQTESAVPAASAAPAASGGEAFGLSELDLPLSGGRHFRSASRRWITWRSALIGFAAVIIVSALTPYNDYVVAGTIFVGSYLPPVLVLMLFVLIVLVNAPLHRWLPRKALSSGELAVIVAMLLIGCSLPSSGCMRMLIPMLVSPFSQSIGNEPRWHNFLAMHLPHWLFPVPGVQGGRSSHEVLWFLNHTPAGESPPYGPWVIPLLAWGTFIAAMFGTLLALAALLRPQWAMAERLPFPLAQLELALIEPPRTGRKLNELLGSRMLWSGVALSFSLQTLRALHGYSDRFWPEIPLYFNLRPVFTRPPWSMVSGYVTHQTVYFTFVGIAFFIQRRAAFSLWSIVLICDLLQMLVSWQFRADISDAAWYDQSLGASVAFAIGFLWIARRYVAAALRAALLPRPAPSGGTHERRVAYDNRWSARFALLGTAAMLAWLLIVGVQFWVAAAIVAFILLGHVVIARIVAETGLPFIRSYNSFSEIAGKLPAAAFTGRDIFFAGVGKILGTFSTRESVMTYGMHGLQVNAAVRSGMSGEVPGDVAHDVRRDADIESRDASIDPWVPVESRLAAPRLRGLIVLLLMSLVIGYVISAGSSLFCYYHYATPIAREMPNKINIIALDQWPREEMMQPLDAQASGKFPVQSYNPWLHMGLGAVITAVLQILTMRFRFWPFGPIGYLVHDTWYAQAAWFSIFLGWLSKVLIVRFGGVKLFTRARPFFVGLIFGEALAAGVWLIFTLLLAWSGHEYNPMSFLPT